MTLVSDLKHAARRVASNRRSSPNLLFQSSTLFLIFVVVFLTSVSAQPSYDDGNYGYDDAIDESGYAPRPPPVVDNLYHDYAARQEAKGGGGDGIGLGGGGGGLLGGWIGTGVTFFSGWMMGGFYHSRNTRNKLNIKFKKDQKELYQQYYNDVYSLQQQNAELINALEQYIAATQGQVPPNQKTQSAGQRRVK